MAHGVRVEDYEFDPLFDSATLRQALRRVGSTVNVIALKSSDGRFFATTATAVTSVCFEPPTLLVCLNCSSAIRAAMEPCSLFSISVLGAGHETVAAACAGGAPHNEREEHFEPSQSMTDALVVRDAQASFICRASDFVLRGTHAIVLADVLEASHRVEADPLLYLDGKYGSFHAR